MRIKEIAGLAVRLLTGTAQTTKHYSNGCGGASCIAMGRAFQELAPETPNSFKFKVWDAWADIARQMNGADLPDWWNDCRTDDSAIALRVDYLRRWADAHGEEEFKP